MLQRVEKPLAFRDLGPVDCDRLAATAARVSEATWQSEDGYKENAYQVLQQTRHIVFRFIRGNLDPRDFYSEPAWDAFKPLLLPVMEQATASYGYADPVFPKAMLARLPAGAEIGMHSDGKGSHAHVHKIHVPLQTNPQALFHIGDESRHMEYGHAYEVNNIARHGVTNAGTSDRVHLIFELFDGAASGGAAEQAEAETT